MVDFLTIAEVRAWLRVHEAEASDEELGRLADTAAARVFAYLERPLSGEGSWAKDDVPFPVVQAVKTVASALYDNRGIVAITDDDLRALVGAYQRISIG